MNEDGARVRDFLLEIGVEEMPARFVQFGVTALSDALVAALTAQRLQFETIDVFGTPRRLGFLVRSLVPIQTEHVELVRGPAASIARDGEGEWTRAAQGFARSQSVDVDELLFKEAPGGVYVFAAKCFPERATEDILADLLPDLIAGVDWPKSMRWGSLDMRFIRPLRWLVALYGGMVVPFTVAGHKTQALTRGHRTLTRDPQPIGDASDYPHILRAAFVIGDIAERRELIVKELSELAANRGLIVDIHPDLLEEVTQLVEFPTAFMGSFEPRFLALPEQVIVTTMRSHQRYFPVYNEEGKLAPYFIGVRNGGKKALDLVVRGNEKVLAARLADAVFFYEEDCKRAPEAWRNRLKSMVYHDRLGSVYDRERRVATIALRLARELQVSDEVFADVESAAGLAKFDLATHLVAEFPELEGYMGGVYGALAGAGPSAAQAIAEQYDPRGVGAAIPASTEGRILALADKLERLIGGFLVLGTPTGSQDPYGLRRAATGIVRIVNEASYTLLFGVLVTIAEAAFVEDSAVSVTSFGDLSTQVGDYLRARLRNILQERGTAPDIADGCIGAHPEDPSLVVACADVCTRLRHSSEFLRVVETGKRVASLLAKESGSATPIDAELFETAEEAQLFAAVTRESADAEAYVRQGDLAHAIERLALLREPVAQFFDSVTVMDGRFDVRANRLALLRLTLDAMVKVFDPTMIV